MDDGGNPASEDSMTMVSTESLEVMERGLVIVISISLLGLAMVFVESSSANEWALTVDVSATETVKDSSIVGNVGASTPRCLVSNS